MKHHLIILITAFFIMVVQIIFVQPTYADSSVIIGVVAETARDKLPAAARILFANNGNGWTVLDSPSTYTSHVEKQMTWTLAFDGRRLGEIKTIDDVKSPYPATCTSCFSKAKIVRLENESLFPKLKNKEERFANWMFLPKYRPIVLNTQPYYADPEKWSLIKPNKHILTSIFPELKKLIKDPYHCNGEPNWDATRINLTIDGTSLFRLYGNNGGAMIVSAGLAQKHLNDCDGPSDKSNYPIWFYIKGDKIKLIGYELDLLDAGDYDNDGEVEFIFHYSGYNRDGYILFESEFSGRFDYIWNYH